MMNFHGLRQGRLVRLAQDGTTLPTPSDLLWIDLLDPTPEEEKAVEALLGLVFAPVIGLHVAAVALGAPAAASSPDSLAHHATPPMKPTRG